VHRCNQKVPSSALWQTYAQGARCECRNVVAEIIQNMAGTLDDIVFVVNNRWHVFDKGDGRLQGLNGADGT
jgi:hypothetical protein